MLSKMLFGADLPTWALFAELILAGSVVILAGWRFTRLADTLAKRLNLAGGWIGLTLLATVTSLPELVTGGTATAIGNVDLALGAIFGSCSFNITLIVLLNALWGGGSVLRGVSTSHSLSSSFGLALIGLALMGIVIMDKFAGRVPLAQVTEISWALLIFVTYLGCVRLVYRDERSRSGEVIPADQRQEVGVTLAVHIALMAVIIVVASWWLARIGDILSVHHIELIGRPLGATFVGALFLGISTSLPEIVTSIAAVRLGNLDLALGNIFGSNMFNIFVIPAFKAVSLAKGDALLLGAGAVHTTQSLIAGLLAILLTAIAAGGLAYKTAPSAAGGSAGARSAAGARFKSRTSVLGRFGFDSILIAVTYVGGMILLLTHAA